MPFFKTTENILLNNGEYFDPNWMDSNTLILPPSKKWDYSRELQIEDIDIWEVIYISGGGNGVYAAWQPYAEFYLITDGNYFTGQISLTTFYGKNAEKKVVEEMKKRNILFSTNKRWVENEDMWLFN